MNFLAPCLDKQYVLKLNVLLIIDLIGHIYFQNVTYYTF